MRKDRRDVVLGLALLGVAAFYFHQSLNIRVFSGMAAYSVTSRTIPQFYAGALVLLSVILIVQALLKRRPAPAPAQASARGGAVLKTASAKSKYLPVALTFILMAVYAGTMPWLGFTASSSVYVFLQVLVLSPGGRVGVRTIAAAAAAAVASSVLVNYVFVNHLGLFLPQSTLGF